MKTFSSFFAVAAAGAAFAAPAAYQSQQSHGVDHFVKFDNVPAGLIDGAPVRGLNELGSHEGLYYSNMGVISATPLLAGLNPQSRPNVLAYDVLADLQGKQELRTDYDDSTTSSFDLKSFYFGCVVSTQETLLSVPLSCSMDIKGYRNGKQVASQTARFQKPLLELAADMTKVELNADFCDVDSVTFDTNGLLESVLLAALMDNFHYITKSSK